jgi:hypothetical protein
MKVATGFHAFYIDLVYYSTGKLLDSNWENNYIGGYFYCATDGCWIGFDSEGGEIFQESFNTEQQARKFANGEKAVDINGQITF